MVVSTNPNQMTTPQSSNSPVSFIPVSSSTGSNNSQQSSNVSGTQAQSSTTSTASASTSSNETPAINQSGSAQQSLNSAVAQAKQDGVQISQGANVQATSQQQINSDYQSETNAINNADAEQKQIDAARNAANNHTALDKAVQQAKQAGIQVTQDPNKTIQGTAQDASNIASQINSDYNQQIASLQNAINAQKSASSTTSTDNHSALDQIIQQAKQDGVNVVQDPDQTVSASDYESQIKAVQQAIAQQQTYNQQYQAEQANYNKNKQAYEKAISDFQKSGVTISGVDLSSIVQKLILHNDANATIKVLSTANGVKQQTVNVSNAPKGVDSKQAIQVTLPNFKGMNGNVITVEYDGDFGSYNGDEITKITRTFENVLPTLDPNQTVYNINDGDAPNNVQKINGSTLWIYNDPSNDFWFEGTRGVETNEILYDKNGNQINIDPNTAYLTVGSLNNHGGLIAETAQLVSSGKALQIKGSSVSAHDGNILYSDKDNDNNESTWDVANSLVSYYGAGLFQVSGNHIDIKWGMKQTTNKPATEADVWVQSSTTIPYIPNNPKQFLTKQTATVHYHYDAIKPAAKSVSYHYDVADIPNAQVSYHDDTLAAPTPQQKTGSADIKYINALTGQEMPGLPEKSSQGNIGSSYNWTEPQIPGYKITKVVGNLNGKYTDGQPAQTVIYYTPIQSSKKPSVTSIPKAKKAVKKPEMQYQTQSQNVFVPSAAKEASVEETSGPVSVASVASAPASVSASSSVAPAKQSNSNGVTNASDSNALPETGMANEGVEFAAAMLALAGVALLKKSDEE